MIERWHRTLKNALKTHSEKPWIEILPIVLLGLRSTVREDTKCSPAELTYGKILRLPSDFFNTSPPLERDTFAGRLQAHMAHIKPVLPMNHGKPKIFVHKELPEATHVFLRTDATRLSLQNPYEDPFEVIDSDEKVFTIRFKGKKTNEFQSTE